MSQIVLPHRGVFVRRVGGREIVASPAVAVFYNKGEVGRILHPVDQGDSSTVLTPSSSTLESLVRLSGSLPLAAVPLAGCSMVDHARLRHRLRDGASNVDGLAVDELAANLMVRAVGVPIRRPSAWSTTRHERIASRVEALLAVRFRENVSLSELAVDSDVSVFEVSRAVSRARGRSVTDLRGVLRFRHALKHLNDDGMTLSALAVESGYSDQAHMSRAFRRLVGMAPAETRRYVAALPRKIVQDRSDCGGALCADALRQRRLGSEDLGSVSAADA